MIKEIGEMGTYLEGSVVDVNNSVVLHTDGLHMSS